MSTFLIIIASILTLLVIALWCLAVSSLAYWVDSIIEKIEKIEDKSPMPGQDNHLIKPEGKRLYGCGKWSE